MKQNAILIFIFASVSLANIPLGAHRLLMLSGQHRILAAHQATPCSETHDSAGRTVGLFCYNVRGQLTSQTYVDTVGRRTTLPTPLSRLAIFGQRPEALANYLRVGGPWPGNMDISGRVIFYVLIGADGWVKDIRLVKDMNAIWPNCTPVARHRVQTMPRWQPALAAGKPVPSLVSLSVRFGPQE